VGSGWGRTNISYPFVNDETLTLQLGKIHGERHSITWVSLLRNACLAFAFHYRGDLNHWNLDGLQPYHMYIYIPIRYTPALHQLYDPDP